MMVFKYSASPGILASWSHRTSLRSNGSLAACSTLAPRSSRWTSTRNRISPAPRRRSSPPPAAIATARDDRPSRLPGSRSINARRDSIAPAGGCKASRSAALCILLRRRFWKRRTAGPHCAVGMIVGFRARHLPHDVDTRTLVMTGYENGYRRRHLLLWIVNTSTSITSSFLITDRNPRIVMVAVSYMTPIPTKRESIRAWPSALRLRGPQEHAASGSWAEWLRSCLVLAWYSRGYLYFPGIALPDLFQGLWQVFVSRCDRCARRFFCGEHD